MPRVSPLVTLLALPVLAAAAGCTRAESAQDKQLAEMREQISRMQQDHDRFDQRLGAVEVAMADEKPPAANEPAKKAQPGPPPRVVQLGGEDDGANDDPNDTSTARPKIEVAGGGGAGGRVRGGSDASGAGMRPSALDPDAKRTYERGLSQVQGKQLDKGLDTLAAFLVKWPDHPYAENAMYWRGEAYYAKGDYAKAAEQFEAVLARFGGGAKAPDALLKLGMCQDKLGSPARAQEYWDRLKNEYPKSDAVRRIPVAGASQGVDATRRGPKESR